MSKKRFRMEYENPETGEIIYTEREFGDADGVPAQVWAEDYAHGLADKGYHRVEEIPEYKHTPR